MLVSWLTGEKRTLGAGILSMRLKQLGMLKLYNGHFLHRSRRLTNVCDKLEITVFLTAVIAGVGAADVKE